MAAIGFVAVAVVTFAGCGSDEPDPTRPTAPLVTPDAGAISVVGDVGEGERHASSIRIAAASDLRVALGAMEELIEGACETEVVPVFGSSGQLKEQIRAGAPFGLFLSADAGFPAELNEAGLVVPGGMANYAVGHLAIVTREGVAPVSSIEELADEQYERITIANPQHAPYGRAAEQALATAGVIETISARLIYGENVRLALDYVETGNVDAGIVALSLVAGGERDYVTVDGDLHEPILQTGAVIAGTEAELTGRCVLQLLLNGEGQARLAQFGFKPADMQ